MKKYEFNTLKVYTNLPEDVELAKTWDKELVAIGDNSLGLVGAIDTNNFTRFTVSETYKELTYFPYVSQNSGISFSSIIFKSDLKEIEVEDEPKYREFKNDLEFFETIGHIGEVITFRFKVTKNKDTYYKEVINQIHYIDGKVYIKLHDTWFTLETLFKELEICLKGEWKPFGIMD